MKRKRKAYQTSKSGGGSQRKRKLVSEPAAVPSAIPGEFEPQEALVFGAGQLIRYYPQLFVDFVRVAHERINLIGILAPEYRELADLLLGAAGLPINALEFIEGQTSSVWARDWSPFVGYDTNGNRCQFYVNRSHMRHRDDEVSREIFEKRFGDPMVEIPVMMEGGNFLSNGYGLILTSQSISQVNANQYSHNQIAKIFENSFSSSQWGSLLPLHAERTGHIDLFATFLAPDLLVLGSANEKEDPINYRSLMEAQEKLEGLPTAVGKLKVLRIPMPSSHDTNFLSYNNVIFANGVLFVPIYPRYNPALDQKVLGMYRELLPGWEVIGIDMRELASKGGSLHCLSVNIPPKERSLPSMLPKFA